jgi:tetratricopeptide (TPR) repeat protein
MDDGPNWIPPDDMVSTRIALWKLVFDAQDTVNRLRSLQADTRARSLPAVFEPRARVPLWWRFYYWLRSLFLILLVAVALGCAGQRAETLYEEGVAFGESGNNREAAEKFAAAIKLDPDVAKYHYGLGATLGNMRFYDQAVLELQEALRLEPYYPKASRALTLVERRLESRRASYIADELQP